jgi:hypothetical protein
MDNDSVLERAVLMPMEKTVESAHARQDLHEAVCAERYKAIERNMGEIKGILASQTSDFHARLNIISTRMWTGTVGTLGAAVAALGGLAFYLMTKGH